MITLKIKLFNITTRLFIFRNFHLDVAASSTAASRAMVANIRSPLTRQHLVEPGPSAHLDSTGDIGRQLLISTVDVRPR